MSNKQESPEFSVQYIDQLLSGPSASKAPAPPAEAPAPEPPKNRPTATRHPRRWILILTAFLVTVVSLCLLLPDLSANLRSAELQARAEEAYSQLVDQSSHHFKLHQVTEHEGEERQEYWSERWVFVRNHLYITQKAKDTSTTYELVRADHHYSKTVTPEDPDAKWVYHGMGSSIDTTYNRPGTLAEAKYTFLSIRGTLAGPEVTYLKDHFTYTTLTLKFDWNGTLVSITGHRKKDSVSYSQAEYTLLPADAKEINSMIRDIYKEASQEANG